MRGRDSDVGSKAKLPYLPYLRNLPTQVLWLRVRLLARGYAT